MTKSEKISFKLLELGSVCNASLSEENQKLASLILEATEEIDLNDDLEEVKRVIERLLDDCAHSDLVYECLTEIYQTLEN